jgi:predicted NAD/FAD-dependent oxidoreductase
VTSVLVIGAGIGGIAVAGRLARKGYGVTVLEKNAVPGERLNKLLQDGHRFDVGPSLFLMPQTYAAMDERMEDHLDLKRVDLTYHLHFEDGPKIQLSANSNWRSSNPDLLAAFCVIWLRDTGTAATRTCTLAVQAPILAPGRPSPFSAQSW